MRASLKRAISLIAVLTGFACAVFGQATSGSIIGTVTDSTAAVVPNAQVRVVSGSKGITETTTTNSSGNYSQTHLLPGEYQVTIVAPGFKAFVQKNVAVNLDSSTRVDATLQTGNVSEQITVSGAPPTLETDRADVSETVGSREVESLPVLNRNFTQLELIMPGAVKNPWQHASSENPQGGLQINTNGQIFGASNFMIDGTDNNDIVLGIIIVNPTIDSVGQFKFTSGNYDAEFAQAGGSVIQLNTKAGSNDFHGSAFEFLQNDIFQARDPFTQSSGLPALRWNQFGGSLSGPIKKSKAFFFADYQGTRRRTGASLQTRVPTQAERQGDFSAFGIPVFDPSTGNSGGGGRTQFADPTRATPSNPAGSNIIPLNRIATQSTNLLGLLPLPNLTPANPFDPNYVISRSELFDSDQFDVRIDHYFSDRVRYFGRYSYATFLKNSPAAFGSAGGPSLNPLNFAGTSHSQNQNGVFGFDYTFSSTLITDFRFGATRYRVHVLPGDYGTLAAQNAGLPGLNLPNRPDTSGLPEIIVPGSAGFLEGFGLQNDNCNCPLDEKETALQWVNNWTKIRGNHTLKWGTDIRRAQNVRNPSDFHRSGVLSFNASVTGDSSIPLSGIGAASFLLGLPNGFQRYAETATDAADRQIRMFYFMQDTWRATNKLTLNYGLRWDTWFPDTSVHAGQGGLYSVIDNLVRVPGVGGVPASGGVNTQWRNLSPRLAIAYALDPKTVIRTGWARSYFQGQFGWTFNYFSTAWPTLIEQQFSPLNSFQPVFSLSVGPTASVFPTIPSNGLLPLPDGIADFYTPANLTYPYVDSWNLSVERQLSSNMTLTVGYVANVGRNLNYGSNLNAAVPGVGPFDPRRPLFNKFGITQTITEQCDCGRSSYNSLQIKANKRFSRNNSFFATYTWSKSLDYGSFGAVTNQYNYLVDHGPSDFDRASVLTFSHEYVLPFGPGQKWLSTAHGFLSALVAGWQWNGITTVESGFPFSPMLSNNSSLNSDQSLRPNLVGNPFAGAPHNRNAWFNPAAYAVPSPYAFGDAGRNSLRGPRLFTADWSLAKNFKIRESMNMQFRWETFNVFNVTNLALPDGNVDDGTAGQIFDVASPMRNMQFGLRFSW